MAGDRRSPRELSLPINAAERFAGIHVAPNVAAPRFSEASPATVLIEEHRLREGRPTVTRPEVHSMPVA